MAERLWLDDRRKPPWGYSLWAKTAPEAIEMLQRYVIVHCSLDHDLAAEHYVDADARTPGYGEPALPIDRSNYKELTGYAVVEWMASTGCWVADISIHTLNERAGEEMLAKIRRHAPHVKCRRVDPHEV